MPSFLLQISDNEIILTAKIVLNVLTFALCILACYTDLSKGRVPNWLTMPFLFMGFAIQYIVGGWDQGSTICLAESLGGMFLGAVFMLLLYFVGGLGGGDVKLFAAVGALKGQKFTLEALLYACLVGGVLALFQIVFRWITYHPNEEVIPSIKVPEVQVIPDAEASLSIEQKKELARKKREEEQKKTTETSSQEQTETKPEEVLHPEDPEAVPSEPLISFSATEPSAPAKKVENTLVSEEEEKKQGIPFGFAISLGVIMTFIMKPGL